MGQINQAIPRSERAEVQQHLDALNPILPSPDITQMDVTVAFAAGQSVYGLVPSAEARVSAKLIWLAAHQTPSPTSSALPSVAPTVKAACSFFGIALPPAPTGVGDVDGQAIDR